MNKNVEIVARAGSGKTTAIVGRANFLINHCNVEPESILMLAFNREAVRTMRERMEDLSPDKSAIPHIRTFHSLALSVVTSAAEAGKAVNDHRVLLTRARAGMVICVPTYAGTEAEEEDSVSQTGQQEEGSEEKA